MARHTQHPGTQRSNARSTTPTAPAKAAPANEAQREAHRGPSQEEIARRAYDLFLARGGAPGNPDEDWLQAERELRLGRY